MQTIMTVIEIIRDVLGVEVLPGDNFREDLRTNAVEETKIILAIEGAFRINITPARAATVHTAEELVGLVEELIKRSVGL